MRIDEAKYSIAELRDMLGRKELIVNREYQRGPRLWPPGPRGYFIDTILTGFPFPKLYFYEYLERATRKTKRELVDGQQRITAIIDFIGNQYPLAMSSEEFNGKKFLDLSEEIQEKFLSYPVSVDVIRNARKADILEMFRRMNAYTLPLNAAEKRHSQFQGEFKWFVNRLVTEYQDLFIEWGLFTKRQIVRMADAELVADMVLYIERGLITTTSRDLKSLYERHDKEYQNQQEHDAILKETINFIIQNFSCLQKSYLMKPYVFLSLFSAMVYNRYGIGGNLNLFYYEPQGEYCCDVKASLTLLESLALAHETKDEEGELAQYVWSCLAGTNTAQRRVVRIRYLLKALRGNF